MLVRISSEPCTKRLGRDRAIRPPQTRVCTRASASGRPHRPWDEPRAVRPPTTPRRERRYQSRSRKPSPVERLGVALHRHTYITRYGRCPVTYNRWCGVHFGHQICRVVGSAARSPGRCGASISSQCQTGVLAFAGGAVNAGWLPTGGMTGPDGILGTDSPTLRMLYLSDRSCSTF